MCVIKGNYLIISLNKGEKNKLAGDFHVHWSLSRYTSTRRIYRNNKIIICWTETYWTWIALMKSTKREYFIFQIKHLTYLSCSLVCSQQNLLCACKKNNSFVLVANLSSLAFLRNNGQPLGKSFGRPFWIWSGSIRFMLAGVFKTRNGEMAK